MYQIMIYSTKIHLIASKKLNNRIYISDCAFQMERGDYKFPTILVFVMEH